ncbi:MAG: Transcriptional repressor SdpR [Microgenomates group bacterium ADurb.Bin219]|nr:MAG: Transcriptional repressor SdpR [Microgenomates group bacterium ADurb.Bin219]HNP89067.1 metalloregulator ArsR/SmtB family transcription factor [Candidatus Woesebacteria bacterium]
MNIPCCPFAIPQMADLSRRKIFEYLYLEGDKTVGEITKKLKLRQPTVSYHLKMMEKERLLKAKKKGREVYYQIKLNCPEGGACFGGWQE